MPQPEPLDLDAQIERHETMLQGDMHWLSRAITPQVMGDAIVDVGSREAEIARLKAQRAAPDPTPRIFIEVVQSVPVEQVAGGRVVVRHEISSALFMDGKLGGFLTAQIQHMLAELEQSLRHSRR